MGLRSRPDPLRRAEDVQVEAVLAGRRRRPVAGLDAAGPERRHLPLTPAWFYSSAVRPTGGSALPGLSGVPASRPIRGLGFFKAQWTYGWAGVGHPQEPDNRLPVGAQRRLCRSPPQSPVIGDGDGRDRRGPV